MNSNTSSSSMSSSSAAENEDRLIHDLINRINIQIKLTKNLGGYQTADQIQQEHIRKYNEDTLIQLSSSKLNIIATGLSDSLENLLKRKDKDETNEHNSWAQSYILNLLAKCMQHQWHHIKSQFRNVQGLDEKEAIRLKEKEEQILPPPLEEALARVILGQSMTCLMRSVVSNEEELRRNSGRVIFQLSATNYESVSGKITEILHVVVSGKEPDDQFSNQFYLIEHLNLNSKRLSELLDRVTRAANSFKKERHQFILSQVLKNAVWNWIDNYPMEFVTLCKMCERLPGNPDQLFDILDGWAKKTAHKNAFWPLQTMLLILCPDIMLKIYKQDKATDYSAKERFLADLKKSLKVPKLADVAASCYVDICKASTYVSKSELSALRYIVPAIETELKERLFNKERTLETPNDLDMMIECLVSSFKISPRKVTTLIPDCLNPDTPPHFRMVLVRSLLRIAREDAANTLPWSPSISDAYALVSGQLKTMFGDYLQSIRSHAALKSATDKKSKQQFEKVQFDTQVMGYLIQLFLADPRLSLYALKTPAQDLEDIRSIITGLCYCSSQFALPEIADVAAETLLKFHNAVYIEAWYEKKMINGFWEISSAVNISLANALIDMKDAKYEQIQKLVTLLEEILLRRNAFLEKSKESLRPEASVRDVRSQGSTKLEIALLIHLCSPEPDICSKCATCFGLLCEEIEILGDDDAQANNPIAANYGIYKKLSTAGVLQTGRQHQQKVIRTLLRRIETPTTGNFAAWEEVYTRWCQLTPVLMTTGIEDMDKQRKITTSGNITKTSSPITDKSPAEIKQEWHNTMGFLVALSGVTLNKETTVRAAPEKDNRRVLLGAKKNVQERTIKVIDSFVEELMDLVVSDNAFIRETTMSLSGTGMSPSVYAVLFRHLQGVINGFFGDAGQLDVSDRSTLFVDQTIGVVKHILDISQTAEDLAIITSFEPLTLLIIRYLNHLVPSTTSLRIKKNFCSLLDVMMIKRQYISFSRETEFRNTLVENIIEWTSDFNLATRKSSVSISTDSTRIDIQNDVNAKNEMMLMKKLPKEVDVACVTTIASLLRGLTLPTSDDDAQGKSPPQLADGAIRSLSNMLSANIHYEYFATMGYHEDHETRSAFLRVIANILNQGTGFDAVEDESADKYEKFVELLLEPDYFSIIALGEVTQITEADEVARILVNFCEQNDKTMPILKKVIHHEVSSTETANTLLRRNSVATKMLAAYTKLIGQPYLKVALYPVMKTLLDNSESMEIDPSRVGSGEDVVANTNRLLDLTKKFIKAIQDSVPHLPLPFREICNYISKVVNETFPGNEKMAIGGIMFLRFICPAIISPEIFGIVSAGALSKETRRGLVLCTKVLQNLANGQMGVRENYMANCNSFVNENMKAIDDLFESFTIISPDYPNIKASAGAEEHKDDDVIMLHHHFYNGLEKIVKVLGSPAINQRDVADRLTQTMQRLGAPPDLEKKKAGTGIQRNIGGTGQNKATNYYEDFMRRFQSLNLEPLKQKKIFYKQGVTKEKYPVFYYIAKRYESSMDMEHLLYLMLKTVQDSMHQPYVIVIDCTLFAPEHQIPLSWCTTWLRHFPDEAAEHLKSIIVVNPNHNFKKYTKRVGKLVGRATKKIVLLQNPVRIFDYIGEAECGLPQSSLAVETDVKSTFSPVVKLSGQYHEKSVTLRITTDLLQLISIKLHPILGKQSSLVDLYHISTILEVNRTFSDDDQEFFIKYDMNGPKAMVLKSPQCQQILQAVNQSKARWKLSKPDSKLANRSFRPQDIPGTLLNVALLNLGSTKNALRVAAYNMLSALCRNSNFSLNLQLLETSGLCIPKNSTQFVIRVSEKLSRTETGLTLEFLAECLHGITKASAVAKYLVLDYVSPWIANLALFTQPSPTPEAAEKLAKTNTVINALIDLSIRETQMKSIILSKVWETFGRQKPDLVNLALKCCVKKAVDSGFGSNNCELIGEMIASMAGESPQLIAGKLISKLIRLIERTSENVVHSELSEHKLWPTIIVHLRLLLLLSFDNLICAQLYLPELLHIICTLFSIGNVNVRITTHGLLINTVHSLYTFLVSADNKLQGLPYLLSEMGQPSFRLLFGIGGSNITADFTTPDQNAKELEKMSITNVDPVVSSIFSMLNTCSANGQCFGTAWHNRWLSFTTISSLRPWNPAVQSRSLITLGIIARSSEYVNDELVESIFNALKSVLATPKCLQEQNDLIVGVLVCLTKLFEYINPASRFITPLFWVATTLTQLYEPRVFTAAIALLEVMLKTMDRWDQFKESVAKTYLSAREPYQAILSKLDNITGVSFEFNFSFAVAAHLLKGLKYPSTKTTTSRLLSTYLSITAKKGTGASVIGYLAALFATEGEVANVDQIAALTGEANRTSPNQLLFNEHMVPDSDSAALLFTFLVTILAHTDREHEQLFIYEALKEGIQFLPRAFPVIYKTFIPKLSTVITSSQIEKMMQAGLLIMEHMFSFSMETATNNNKLGISHLKKLGFQGLPDCGAGFNRQSSQINESIVKTCGELITCILTHKQ
ncbi:neurofibromin [Cavenderia fasciculata]|uniref:Neurofibromin n=1 Tax=Cavenderia fasciculata TaxID=261658 RepID=F4PX08_CACFS|nr:neurofibromin [Cavenderia fasciculata]EGG19811.1 neurofibromin [Cavenderia fasciculata]|eukprot:XP_004358157.1 neurofibromin [Cavenderia fasciculata]